MGIISLGPILKGTETEVVGPETTNAFQPIHEALSHGSLKTWDVSERGVL